MRAAQERNRQGIPVPDRSWKLSDWLDYWLDNIVAANRRPATYSLYDLTLAKLVRRLAEPVDGFEGVAEVVGDGDRRTVTLPGLDLRW